MLVQRACCRDKLARWRPGCNKPVATLVALATIGVVIVAQAQDGGLTVVQGARPASDLLFHLGLACKCVITYEDPRWQPADLEDTPDPALASKAPPGVHWKTVKRREIALTIPAPVDLNADAIGRTIQEILAADEQMAQRRRLRVIAVPAGWHVAPVAGSVLDVPVSVTAKGSDVADALTEILKQVHDATGTTIGFGLVPDEFLRSVTNSVVAKGEPARDVIARVLAATGRKLTWRLLQDATLGIYMLNLDFVDPGRCIDLSNGRVRCDPGDSDRVPAALKRPVVPVIQPFTEK